MSLEKRARVATLLKEVDWIRPIRGEVACHIYRREELWAAVTQALKDAFPKEHIFLIEMLRVNLANVTDKKKKLATLIDGLSDRAIDALLRILEAERLKRYVDMQPWQTEYALTLQAPWAECFRLGKDVENRSWACHLKRGTWIGIHEGKGLDLGAFSWLDQNFPKLKINRKFTETPRGRGILVVARFAGNFINGETGSNWYTGPIAWYFDKIIILPEPVPHKGAQRLWKIKEEARSLLTDQLKAAANVI